ncbi:MAG: carboxypeptidase regulatory-like domain-containing protein [Acidobacteria bacterium]|nr:carboxypeptidase regulatory-like domain-containing protein [Acidobacteriota bacterium]
MKSLSHTMLLLGILVCAPALATAAGDKGRITGSVTSLEGHPLRDAVVRIVREVEEGELFTLIRSDSRGFFQSAHLTPGIYHLQISRQGYEPVATARFAVDEDRSIALEIALREWVRAISREDDARNWSPGTVLRGTSQGRLIFRSASGSLPESAAADAESFTRSGAMSIASGAPAGSRGFLLRPHASQSGVSSNFALTEPLGSRSRIILSGQMDIGDGSFWRMRNTYQHRPDGDHDYRASVGYGRIAGHYPCSGSISSNDVSAPSGLETFDFSVEGSTRFLDLIAVRYGIDYTRLYSGKDSHFLHPSIEILLTPAEGWSLRTSLASRRPSATNTLVLPEGETIDLSEPTLITMVGDRLSMSQIRHSEFAARKTVTADTAVEIALYNDYVRGPGLPLMVTEIVPGAAARKHLIEMNEEHSSQRGVRVTLDHKVLESLRGSIAYIYGEARGIADGDTPESVVFLSKDPAAFLRQRFEHSLTGRIDVTVPLTLTGVMTTVRWDSGNPLTALDWFSDRMDIGTRSVNFEIRQPVPRLPGSPGRWEILLDFRNVLNQGIKVLPTEQGELVLNRNPRSLRYGLNYRFN